MVIHPALRINPLCEPQECNDLANVLHSIEHDLVHPVFFAVVPDSFMTRTSIGHPASAPSADDFDWAEEQDAPVVAPRDRWSF